RWTGTEWQAVGGTDQGPAGYYASSMHWQGDRLLVGGWFDSVRGADGRDLPAKSIAIFERGHWVRPGVSVGQPSTSHPVFDFHGDANGILVGGQFGTANGQPASHLMRFDLPLFASGFEPEEAAAE